MGNTTFLRSRTLKALVCLVDYINYDINFLLACLANTLSARISSTTWEPNQKTRFCHSAPLLLSIAFIKAT